MCYNRCAEDEEDTQDLRKKKRKVSKMNAPMNIKMTKEIRADKELNRSFSREEKEQMGIAENCSVSAYSLFAFAGGILMAIGTVIYSVIAL